MSSAYEFARGEINPASDSDQFWPEGAPDLKTALEHHGYTPFPDVELGTDGLQVEVYAVDSAKTIFARKYRYVANLSFGFSVELVFIPLLGDLTAFLRDTAPLCMAQLQQVAFDRAEGKERDQERRKKVIASLGM